jgi:endonuclease-3
LARLDRAYPDPRCALHHDSPYQLLVATILSAQCTDKVVNTVTQALFAAYPTVHDLAQAASDELEHLIFRTGFYRNKSKHLREMARKVVEEFGGEIPATFQELVALPGVARKTANVLLNVWHDRASGVVVDTHVARISRLLGLADAEDPDKIADTLEAKLPRRSWIRFSLQLIEHGRAVCIARRPDCPGCVLNDVCPGARL